MVAKKKKTLKDNEEGQALFEMLIFLPVLIFVYTIIFTVGNSINVSINQQKVTRRYFYYLIKGNSYLPTRSELDTYGTSFDFAGISMVGIADRLDGGGSGGAGPPISPCFKFNSFFTGDSGESCEDPNTGEQETNFVRVYTAYGICGETFSRADQYWRIAYATNPGEIDPKSNPSSCAVTNR